MRRKSVLWLLPFLAAFWLLTPPPVLAPTYQLVNVWVAADEEFIYYATSPLFWGYSNWRTLAYVYVAMVDYRFWTEFHTTFNITRYVEWDSNDSCAIPEVRMNETIDETGFTVGYPRKMLIAFTGQDIGEYSYGVATRNWRRGAVLVELWLDWTDNILQHELSHLYSCNDTNVEGFDCVMNRYPTWIGFPFYMHVPYALLTENWCTVCYQTFWTEGRVYRWGTETYYSTGDYGGGGGGGGGMPPFGQYALEGDLNGTL